MDQPSFGWVATMLSQVVSSVIHTVTFSLWRHDLKAVEASSDWDRVQEVLSSSRFKSLKKIAFRISLFRFDEYGNRIVHAIKDRFSEMDEKGLISIEFVEYTAFF
ncbi:hypothetical protein K474DRAFT_950077 [Panus rudis PR-1116 ss-1]|nr:hypothetical protein K474DRAFT_950077 [Panus rudis PR-1116 ss-1]